MRLRSARVENAPRQGVTLGRQDELEEQGGGYNTVDGAGRETWVHNASRAYNQTYVRVGDWEHLHDRSTIADELDRLLCRPPAAG